MAGAVLTAYWITSPDPHAPAGFGVTAWSLDDAISLIHAFDFGQYLPDDLAGVQVLAGVRAAQLDQPHVAANMGPISERGLWYPFVTVGIPNWAEERLHG